MSNADNNAEQTIRAAIDAHTRRTLQRARDEQAFAHKIAPTAARRLQHVPCDPQSWSCWVTGIGETYTPYELVVRLYVEDLDGFKDQRLSAVLEPLCDADKMETKDWPSSLCREYRFEYPSDSLIVIVFAYVRSDSPTCHLVEVGTKTRTVVDVEYALRCD